MDDTYKRVARALADVERPRLREHWYEQFLWALRRGAIPAGRVTSNAGAQEHKPATSTINCTVSGTIRDSMDDILGKVHEAGLTLKAGCGIGYEFSTLRPRGAYVSGAGAYTSGPLSFMDIYDKMCFTVSSAGGRRGAQMGTFDVGHPDVDGVHPRQARDRAAAPVQPVAAGHRRVHARGARGPATGSSRSRCREAEIAGEDIVRPQQVRLARMAGHGELRRNDEGLVLCKVYKTMPARRMWDVIMSSTYDFAEPGFILIDRVNEMNNNWWCENIRATNPCGEQPLPPYGSCLLGSVNLTRFVRDPFTDDAALRLGRIPRGRARSSRACSTTWSRSTACRCEQQRDEILRKRRHGMGFLGLGSTHHAAGHEVRLARIGEASPRASRRRWRSPAGKRASSSPREGPGADHERRVRRDAAKCCASGPRWRATASRPATSFRAACCTRSYSRYMQRVAEVAPQLVEKLAQKGARFTHHSSIAPTGTISLSLANNASNGIEPSFAHHYFRNVIREGRKTKEKIDVFSFELLAYRELVNPEAMPGGTGAASGCPTTSRRPTT